MKNNTLTSKTIEWLRFFCSAEVVFIHALGVPQYGHDFISCQYGAYDTIRILFSLVLSQVAVPTFFLISGYLFFIRLEAWNTEIWKEKLKNRTKTLLIPYILWNIIAIVFALCLRYLNCISKGNDVPPDMLNAFISEIGGIKAFWNSSFGGPYNFPFWYIRDLIVFIILTPAIFIYIKKTKIIGLILLYLLYLFKFWGGVTGLSVSGLFFFSMGAFLSVHQINFASFFKRFWIVTTCLSFPLVIIMVVTYGNNMNVYKFAYKLFILLGSSALIGFIASLFEKERIKVHPLLSNSSFLIYAAHGTIVLPIIQSLIWELSPSSQTSLILCYFAAPLSTIALLVYAYHFLNRLMPKTLSVLTGRGGSSNTSESRHP